MIIELEERRINELLQEIKNLRERNSRFETQARVLDIFERAMQGIPPNYVASPDIVWGVEQDIRAFKNRTNKVVVEEIV